MKKSKLLIIAVLLIAFNTSEAQFNKNISVISKENARLELNSLLSSSEITSTKTISLDSNKMKSPFLGGLFSAVIPGGGQLYTKNYLKSAIFIAAEAGLWILYSVFQSKGNDQTDFYQKYATSNWDVRRYAQWLVNENFPGSSVINPNEQNLEVLRSQINQCESQNFSHTLPPYGDQQYYEVIGKYQNYVTGWSEAVGLGINKNNYGTFRLPQVDYYMGERQKANDYYDNGTYTLIGVMVNHIVSTIDGVLSVNSYNNKLKVQGTVSLEPVFSHRINRSTLTPFAHISITF